MFICILVSDNKLSRRSTITHSPVVPHLPKSGVILIMLCYSLGTPSMCICNSCRWHWHACAANNKLSGSVRVCASLHKLKRISSASILCWMMYLLTYSISRTSNIHEDVSHESFKVFIFLNKLRALYKWSDIEVEFCCKLFFFCSYILVICMIRVCA